MERKIYHKLKEWKSNPYRKPLVLQGARQVGKTYIVNLFGMNEYTNVVYLNFEQEHGLKDFFKELIPEKIILKISAYKRKEIIKGFYLGQYSKAAFALCHALYGFKRPARFIQHH